ncbi:Dephospho-CoA kinase [Paraliobacillus sp. PM-2]|uniref:dephospho-CoA kinase n=1 Tax=Paraliobacillus sp. PM-2 TaxID=1462524 RepID=UPI00061CB3C9|nr:dephospho-CoA kinase [Paraliobacillus sp. PM-2]CQR48102.1 Dephospho-CoA kinase [Paraliobacillus sp. PM-2]
MTKIIGLTGGIASGKSTVSNMLRKRGIPIIDADRIAKEAVEPNQKAYRQIVATFGASILQKDGQLDRKKLGNIVFANECKRQQLNEIVHPQVRKVMLDKRDQLIKQKQPIIVLDIPLLFESNLEDLVDLVIVVYSHPDIQLERLMKRNQLSREEAQKRIHSQLSIRKKAELADLVIDNNGSIEDTKEQCEKIMNKLV